MEGSYSNWNNSSQSQVRQFQDFILRVSKYPTLSIFNEKGNDAVKKVILVEVCTRLSLAVQLPSSAFLVLGTTRSNDLQDVG